MTFAGGLVLLPAAELKTYGTLWQGDGITSPFDQPLSTRYEGGAALSKTLSLSNFTGTFNATAEYGKLSVYASATGTEYQPRTYSPLVSCGGEEFCIAEVASASAVFFDTLTLSGQTGQAYFVFRMRLHGSGRSDDPAFASGGLVLLTSITGHPQTFSDFATVPHTFEDAIFPFSETTGFVNVSVQSQATPFTFGQPIHIGANLFAGVTIDDAATVRPYSFSAFADFANTAEFEGFNVYSDPALQNEIVNYTVMSQSGSNYVATGAVPEPTSGTLFAVGLGALLIFCRQASNR